MRVSRITMSAQKKKARREPGRYEVELSYASAASDFAPYASYHGVAAFRRSFTFWMFFTPSVFIHSTNAFSPCFANTGTPSAQVARPQSTPLNFTPDSAASSSVSENSLLLTPAER